MAEKTEQENQSLRCHSITAWTVTLESFRLSCNEYPMVLCSLLLLSGDTVSGFVKLLVADVEEQGAGVQVHTVL